MEKHAVEGMMFHSSCFKCCHPNCGRKLGTSFSRAGNDFYCGTHYKELFKLKGRYEFDNPNSTSVAQVRKYSKSSEGESFKVDAEKPVAPSKIEEAKTKDAENPGRNGVAGYPTPLAQAEKLPTPAHEKTPKTPLKEQAEAPITKLDEGAVSKEEEQEREEAQLAAEPPEEAGPDKNEVPDKEPQVLDKETSKEPEIPDTPDMEPREELQNSDVKPSKDSDAQREDALTPDGDDQ